MPSGLALYIVYVPSRHYVLRVSERNLNPHPLAPTFALDLASFEHHYGAVSSPGYAQNKERV